MDMVASRSNTEILLSDHLSTFGALLLSNQRLLIMGVSVCVCER